MREIPAVLFHCLRHFARHPRRALPLAACVLTSVALEAALPLSTKHLIDRAVLPRDAQLALIVLAVLLGLFLLNAAIGAIREYLASDLGARLTDDLRLALFGRLQEMPARYYATAKVGDVVSRMTVDVGVYEYTVTEVLPLHVQIALTLQLNVALLFVLEWRLALFVLLCPPAFFLTLKLINPRALAAIAERQPCAAR